MARLSDRQSSAVYSLESTNGFFRIYIQNADEKKKKKKNTFPRKKG